MAQPFDADSMKLAGEPSRIAEDVTHNPQTNRTSFSVSETGVLAFRTGGLGGTPMGQLVWFDREGQQLGTVGQPGPKFAALEYGAQGCLFFSPLWVRSSLRRDTEPLKGNKNHFVSDFDVPFGYSSSIVRK